MWVGGFQNKIGVRIFLDHTVYRGERGHAGHVPSWTSSITDGGDEEKINKKLCEMKNFITNTGYKFK
jgi:hypothetical protein